MDILDKSGPGRGSGEGKQHIPEARICLWCLEEKEELTVA